MLTVVFATRNRAQILKKVLESYCDLEPPESGWKLVVVDNGSTDETPQVLAAYASRLPLFWIIEHNLGKNYALNAGLRLVEGDLAVFTDDDAFPRADWLMQFRRSADSQPGYSIFGGTIIPRWEAPPPSWLEWIDLAPIFTITPSYMEEGELAPTHVTLVQGPNMAIRSCIFQSGVRFNTSIGPRGSNYPMGSETELILRLHRQGHRARHVKGAVVEHFVRNEQLNKAWVLRRAIRFGRGWFRMAPNPKQWLGIPRYLVRDVPKAALRMAAATILLDPKARFRAHWRLNYLLGEGYEAFLMARDRNARSTASDQ
jgi:glycosyltransferase involved in cell wall biosynthesis